MIPILFVVPVLKKMIRLGYSKLTLVALLSTFFSMTFVLLSGCSTKTSPVRLSECGDIPCADYLQQISSPSLSDEEAIEEQDYVGPPITLENFDQVQPWELSLDECVRMSLQNSRVLQKLGGVVLNSPQAATTLVDQGIVESGPQGVESALSAFDAQLTSVFNYARSERSFNNAFIGAGAPSLTTNASDFRFQIDKQTAYGGTLTFRNLINYNRNNSPANIFGSAYDLVNQLEFRQPLARGAGTLVNRIAGPNALPGQYNGVLIARVRSDQSLADFEASVRELVRNVETNYWELYNAWRNLDTQLTARDLAQEIWDNRKLRFDNGVGRPDDEAQARQQYYTFSASAVDALAGRTTGQLGVLGAERNLRRLIGVPPADGRVIRPSSEPIVAPVALDWDRSHQQAKQRRVELRRQKWVIRQRELELTAARQLNRWTVDAIGNYGWRGFGDNLFGSRDRVNGSAVEDLFSGDLDEWTLGLEINGPVGKRAGHLAVRSAELSLIREHSILAEQEKQVAHDLNATFTEVDRALMGMKASFNARIASQDEFEPRRKRVQEGQDQVFFLLDTQQRQATAESALHRAIADYNLAILDYYYTTGSLLSRFNIRLTEGSWSEDAEIQATTNAGRLVQGNRCCADTSPLSAGTFNQQASVTPAFISESQTFITESTEVTEEQLPFEPTADESEYETENKSAPETSQPESPVEDSLDFEELPDVDAPPRPREDRTSSVSKRLFKAVIR